MDAHVLKKQLRDEPKPRIMVITSADTKCSKSYQALYILCVAFCLLFTANGFAQQAYLDSLLAVNESYVAEDGKKFKLLANIARAYEPFDLAKAEQYAEQNNEMVLRLDMKRGIAFTYSELGRIYNRQGKYQEGKVAFEATVRVGKENGDSESILSGLLGVAGCETKLEGYAKAVHTYLEVEKEAKQANHLEFLATAWLNLAACYANLKDFDKALNYLTLAENYYNSIEKKEFRHYQNMANLYTYRGLAYIQLQEFSLALENFQKALDINLKINDKTGTASTYMYLASLYHHVNDPEKAIEYINQALLLIQPTNYNSRIQANLELGKSYNQLNNHEQEIASYLEALRLTEITGNKTFKLIILTDLGEAYLAVKDYREAFYYYQGAHELVEHYGNKIQEAYLLQILAEICLKGSDEDILAAGIKPENKLPEAVEMLTTAYGLAEEFKNLPVKANSSHELSFAYEQLGDYTQALKYYRIYTECKDSISGDKTQSEIARQEFKFYFDKKEAEYKFNQQLNAEEIERQKLLASQQQQIIRLQKQDLLLSEQEKEIEHLAYLQEKAENEEREQKLALSEIDARLKESSIATLTKENELKEEKLSASIVQRNLFIVIGFLIIISTAFAAISYRNLQTKRTTVLRNKISRDLHDDIGATLSSISLYTEAVKQKLEKHDINKAQEIIHIIGDQSREMIESMSDIVWAANPENDKFSKFLTRIHDYGVSLFGARNIAFNFLADQSLQQLELKMDIRNNLFLICKEALNNAAKYSGCKNVQLKFEKNGQLLHVLLKDDGKGFEPNNVSRGNGLKIMRTRIDEIHGEYSLLSAPGQGTEIKLLVVAA